MYPFADPYASPQSYVRTFDPADAQKLVDGISDALCPVWRKDAGVQIWSSTPRVRDPQTHELKEGARTKDNFYEWTMDRRNSSGLVKRINIIWGKYAVDTAAQFHEAFSLGGVSVPVFVVVNIDKTRIAVQGPHDKKGTTKYRLVEDVKAAPWKGGVPQLKFRFVEV